VRDQKKIILKVSAEDADTVQGRLDELVRAYPGIGLVDVVADSRLTKGQCVLETEIGVIDASLDKQLEIIEKSFRQHLSSART
jgi:type III secretion protein L